MSKRFRCLVLLALLGSACAPSLAQREIAAQPAMNALRFSKLADARKAAQEAIGQDSGNPYARVVDAIARYRETMHALVTDIGTLAIGLFQLR